MDIKQFSELVAWMRANETNGARQDSVSFDAKTGDVTLHVCTLHEDYTYEYTWPTEEISGLFNLGYSAEEIITTAYAEVENNICDRCEQYTQGWEHETRPVCDEMLCIDCLDSMIMQHDYDKTDAHFNRTEY